MADGTAILNQIAGALDGLANEPLRLIGEDRPFNEMWGWNQPPMNRHDFAAFVRGTIPQLQRARSADFTQEDIASLERIPSEISYILANSMPQLPGGNSFHVFIVIDSLNGKIKRILEKYTGEPIDWEEVGDKSIYPAKLISELRQLQSDIASIRERRRGLDEKVSQILEAATASKTLGKDLEAVRAARESFLGIQRVATEHQITIEQAKQKAESVVGEINKLEGTASGLVANTQAAFAAATTVGLGSEFDAKAKKLSLEVMILSLLLAAVLSLAGYMTYNRLEDLQEVITAMTEKGMLNLELVWANIAMTLASLSAPIWAAWFLTKQIGQRFRLSEDYAFKATVAKAYAGYRQEASRLNDPEFEKRLYGTAISRIDEPPLRYVERENEGSPFHAVISRLGSKIATPEQPKE